MYHGNIRKYIFVRLLFMMCVNKYIDKHFYELKLLVIHNSYSFQILIPDIEEYNTFLSDSKA